MIDIKETAKEMSKEIFINEHSNYDCPSRYELKDNSVNHSCIKPTCKECWEKAVKDMKFKDDLEGENIKELSIIDAMKMPIGTEFEVIIDGEKYNMNAKIIKSKQNINEKELVWDNRTYIKVSITESILDAKFIPIQKPVKGIEAITSGNKIKVDHYLTRGIYEFNDYMDFNIMCRFLYNFENSEVIKIINEGLWYIKEN